MATRATAELARHAERIVPCVLGVLCGCFAVVGSAHAQTTRVAVLQAEDRRAPTATDLVTLRSGARGADPLVARVAVRALGRLERPALIADITPALRHALPEVRAEAANAIGQAAQGWKRTPPASGVPLDAAATTLTARLKIEADADVRAAICETLARLPYTTATQVERVEQQLLAAPSDSITDRLGVAKGFEALVRLHRATRPPSGEALARIRARALPVNGDASTGTRIRRLSLETLIVAGAVDDELVSATSRDGDAQVRRLAMRAAGGRGASVAADAVLSAGLADDSPIVRLETLRARFRPMQPPPSDGAGRVLAACRAAAAATGDRDVHVALFAFDQLAACGASPEAMAALERAVEQTPESRGWHRLAHAMVALATAAPDRAAAAMPKAAASGIWQMRMYAARAAAILKNRDALEQLARDGDDNVREAAVEGLRRIAGHDADATYIAQLSRAGHQVLRVAATALEGTARADAAVPPLEAALKRLVAEGKDNSHDARAALEKTLASLGHRVPPSRKASAGSPVESVAAGRRAGTPRGATPAQPARAYDRLTADELKRLASPRARVTIRGVGTFELALFTAQAPATVLRFAHLAEAGYYNGLTFHRVVPSFVIQGGSPGASEYIGDAAFMRDEVGLWPHVRGAVGISTRGRDTGDAQIFIDLVDNPRLDHDYTVFGQVLNGIDVVDQILEGDVIERVEILTQ